MRSMMIVVVSVLALALYSEAQVTPGVSFALLGGAGYYPQVVYQANGTWPSCDVPNPCQKVNKTITATNLAPFNEEVSIQLRGPLQMTRIAVYQLVNGQQQLVSNWQPGTGTTNLVFLLACGNDWSICQGSGLGYANSSGTGEAPSPQNFNGYLPGAGEMTLMSGVPCNGDCGWYRGTGYHGWAGDKIFVIETSMPTSLNSNDAPAIWSLNAQIPRTAQYGCNCGRSGCGEFDIAEIINNGDTKLYQTLYSYNGNQGSPGWFSRPLSSASTYYVHYSVSDNRIYAVNLPGGCFQYPTVLSSSYISNIQALATPVAQMSSSPQSNMVGTCPSSGSSSSPTTAAPATTAAPKTTTAAPATTATTAVPTTKPAQATTASPTSSASSIIPGRVIIKSVSNSLYIVANSSTGSNLVASASSAAAASVFTITNVSTGGYTIWSVGLSAFVSADSAGASPLIANRGSASTWENFVFTKQPSGYYTITSSADSEFVTVISGLKLLANVTVTSSPPSSCLFALTSHA